MQIVKSFGTLLRLQFRTEHNRANLIILIVQENYIELYSGQARQPYLTRQ